MMNVIALYIASEHVYRGHHGKEPGTDPMVEVDQVECVAGRGLRGDRYFENALGSKGQITFFAQEVHDEICNTLGLPELPASVYRRNVITSGVDLNELVGREFLVQGVRFFGIEECRPCYWMDRAVAPGAEAALEHQGGLRARIVCNGSLRAGDERDYRCRRGRASRMPVPAIG